MDTYFKAVRADGTDFHTGTIDYGSAAKSRNKRIKHPSPAAAHGSNASRYFSVSTVATDCTGFSWGENGARLFEVEAVGDVWTPDARSLPNKRAATELRILRELPASQLFGPNGELILAIIAKYDTLTKEERDILRAAYLATETYDALWAAHNAVAYDGRAGRAGLDAARSALYYRLGGGWGGVRAACGAALAVLCRHLIDTHDITQKHYDALSHPWRQAIGPIHPDDKAVK